MKKLLSGTETIARRVSSSMIVTILRKLDDQVNPRFRRTHTTCCAWAGGTFFPVVLFTTSQKHRTKHLGVCRLLKVLFAIFTNRSLQQQQKTAHHTTHPQHTTTTKMSRLCPTLGSFALSFHGHVSGAPNAWRRGSLSPHAKCP